MFNEDEEKLAHENWYKNNDPIAYKFYRDLSPEFETDFYTSETAWLARAKAQAVPDTHIVVPRNREVVVAIEKMVEQQVEASGITSDVFRLDGWRILDAIQEASESGAEG
ncbi:hypothetical protein QQA06_05665 [Acinetobacter baumannii]|uniref:hypothetical protein n=1 Tax=Acinetobacter baumannii TaxID=470 RepID=UPI0028C2567E|nr:hypothetical protein [Acinetobacter baumannii]MDV5201949.1 hypothetical protein [Acinetobacter baumannii]MDV5209714.1 hypothetical protein [Acinetobacter baumannii]MDV5262616.1 hypothetical protein [Acinetobacter baumannii]MDV5274146.1 hypothetical protein [Acinetobacter baumannii]HDZ1841536.1 hypothetical protein [Acinetobacter baumannii]